MIIHSDQNIQVPNYTHFGQYMLDHLRKANDDDVCLENGITRETLTYKEATQYAVNLSVGLSKLGIKRGDVLAIGSEPFLQYVPTVLAVTFTGAAYTPLDLEIGRAILQHKLRLVRPKYFICSALFWEAYEDVLKSCGSIETYIAQSDIPGFSYTLKSLKSVEVDVHSFKVSEVQGKIDPVLILYSSGTTGMPKGVEITHYSCILTCLPDGFREKPWLQTAFMGYSSPWCINIFVYMTYKFLVLGRKIVFTNEISVSITLKILRDCQVDVMFVSPANLYKILISDETDSNYFDSVKMIYCRSSPLHERTIKRFYERFPRVKYVIQAMGLTECGEPMSEIWASKYKPGSVGMVAPGMQVKVVDPNTRAILGPNQQGEICVKGSMIMKRYLDIDHFDYMDNDGFYKTGDLGYYDDDKYFYVIDRLTDRINCGGVKVPPVALENILLQHPGVTDAGVIGKPDPVLLEVPVAFVVKKPENNVTESELIDFVAPEVLPKMRLTGGVIFIPEIPRNPRGKILRRKLREMLPESCKELKPF